MKIIHIFEYNKKYFAFLSKKKIITKAKSCIILDKIYIKEISKGHYIHMQMKKIERIYGSQTSSNN